MNTIKKECMNCVYGGVHNVVEDWFMCECEDKIDRIEVNEEFYKHAVKGSQDDCEHFIPTVDINEEDIEAEYHFSIHHKCPHCGHEDVHYSDEIESEEMITCESCGKQYQITWCMY